MTKNNTKKEQLKKLEDKATSFLNAKNKKDPILLLFQAVESKGRMIKYQLIKHEEKDPQLTLDEIFDEALKMKVKTH